MNATHVNLFFGPYSFSERNLVKVENDAEDSNEREMRLT